MATRAVSTADVQAHLERVLDSAAFRGAERSRTLLRYIVEEALQGRADRLKDYTLGAEALGRGDAFDPRTDPIARVEASRLRSRLDLYYGTEGAADRLRIALPKGGYVPLFEAAAAPDRAASGVPAARVTPWSGVTLLTGAVGLVAVVVVAGWLLAGVGGAVLDAPETRLELTTPPTTDPLSLSLAPDGRALVFVASDAGGSRLWLRRLDAAAAQPLPGTEDATLPFWSADGRAVGFFADGRIRAVELATGVTREIAGAPVPGGAAWGRDGAVVHAIVPDSALFATRPDGQPPRPLTRLGPGHTGHRSPAFLPDGRRFLFYVAGAPEVRGVYLGDVAGAPIRRVLTADTAAVVAAPDHLLYGHRGTLFAQRIDPQSVAAVGPPVRLADGLGEGVGLPPPVAAAGRTIAYRAAATGALRQLRWYDRRGTVVGQVGAVEANGPAYGSLSPDGRRLAVQRSLAGNTDIWLIDLERGTPVRFTSEPQADIAPVWSPRGDRIAYASQVDGVFDIFDKPLDGGPARRLLHTPVAENPTDWSRDGRVILYRTVDVARRSDMDIWALPLDGGAPVPVIRTAFEERDAQFSPDGRWLAFQSNDTGRPEIYLQPFGRPGERIRVSDDGGVQARWRADGRELFYVSLARQLTAVAIGRRPDGTLQPGPPSPLFRVPLGGIQGVSLPGYVPALDGERFLVDTLIEQPAPPISIILNWKAQS
jgi:Tol biopolymer transport system component